MTPSVDTAAPNGLDVIVTVTVAGGVVPEDGYKALIPAISPVDRPARWPMGMPAGIVTIVGRPLLEKAVVP